MARAASHIQKNRYGMLYFRIAVPRDLQSLINKKEIHRSLGTYERRKALPAAAALWVECVKIFEALRQHMAKDKKTHKTRLIEDIDLGIKIDFGGDQEAEMKALLALLEARKQRDGSQALHTANNLPNPTKSLSALIESYIEFKRMKDGTKESTLEEYRHSLILFEEVIGQKPLNDYSREDGEEYYKALSQLPRNLRKHKEYRSKSLSEVLTMEIPDSERIELRTIQKHLQRVSTFFAWCHEAGYYTATRIPCKGLVSDKRVKKESGGGYQPFTPEELHLLFHSTDYNDKLFTKPSQYWLPLLGLFTGARIAELAQLRPEHIIEEDGVHMIDIRPTQHDEGYFDPKTEAGARTVPVHSVLITSGFIDFVDHMRNIGAIRLFPELPWADKGGFGASASKWFSRYRRKCGIEGERVKVFHSFRSLLVQTLRNIEPISDRPETRDIQAIIGHTTGDTIGAHYGADILKPKVKKDIIERFLPEVHLSHIVNSWPKPRIALKPRR